MDGSLFDRGRAALAMTALLWLGQGWAASSDAQRILELEKKLEELTQRLLRVEAGNAEGSAKKAPAQATQPPPAPQTERPPDVAAMPVPAPVTTPLGSGIPLHAFVDAGYARDSIDVAGRKGGFALGTVDLYMTPSFGTRVKSIVELVFEQDSHGSLAVDLERVQLGYTFSDALTAWIGRYHTPVGYWNDAYHHGAQLQTSILRPRFLDFEDHGGILPVHGVGLMGSGSVSAGEGRVKYDLFTANGSSIRHGILQVSGFKDDDSRKMVGGNVRYLFGGALKGLTLGVHGMSSNVNAYAAEGELAGRTRLNIAGAFGVYERHGWELISEYYAFRNRDLIGDTGRHSSWAGFGQLGRTFADVWTVYARHEKAALDQSDPYFSSLEFGRSYHRSSLGLRYDLNPTTALKLEFGRTIERVDGIGTRSNGARAQVAVRF